MPLLASCETNLARDRVDPDGSGILPDLQGTGGGELMYQTFLYLRIFCLEIYLTDGTFHLQIDQPLQFDRVFHGELPDEVIDKAIDGETHGFVFW